MQTSIYIKYLSFVDPERGEFGEIFPEVMIFHAGHTRVAMKYKIYSIAWHTQYACDWVKSQSINIQRTILNENQYKIT